MAIDVFAADEQSEVPVDTARWARLAEEILRAEGIRGDAELSMLFIDAGAMAELNQRFLGKPGPTDVLSFPIDDDVIVGGRSPDNGDRGPRSGSGDPDLEDDLPTLLGDVVICPAVAHQNAPTHAGTYEDELALLVVHGILHLLGMDHEDDDEATAMEAREQELLDRFHRRDPAGEAAGATGDDPTGPSSADASGAPPAGPAADGEADRPRPAAGDAG